MGSLLPDERFFDFTFTLVDFRFAICDMRFANYVTTLRYSESKQQHMEGPKKHKRRIVELYNRQNGREIPNIHFFFFLYIEMEGHLLFAERGGILMIGGKLVPD